MSGPWKPVGIDSDSLFPPRVEARLTAHQTLYYALDYGVVGNGVTDDTAALNALLVRARNGVDGKKGIYLPPNHTYLVSAPLMFQTGVSIIGGGWSQDSTYHSPALIKVASGFVGTDVLKIDPGSGVVPKLDGTAGTEPDLSWHWGKMEGFSILGTGLTGPNAINPGWFGEASSIRNVQIYQVKDGIYLKGPQASATIDTVSVFKSRYGVNCDGIGSTVRLIGMSGDNNTSFLRVKGGVSTNVTLVGPKIENYDTGTGDPVFLIEDLTGGVVTILGGWADTDGARDAVVRLIQPGGGTSRPKILLLGFAANSLYTNLIKDEIQTFNLPVSTTNNHPVVFYNENVQTYGDYGGIVLGNLKEIRGWHQDKSGTFPMLNAGSGDSTDITAGRTGGVKVLGYGGSYAIMRFGANQTNSIGFYGATAVTKQTVTGVRGTGAAQQSLLTALSTMGLLTDSTTAGPAASVNLTDAATIATDASTAALFKVTIAADRTLGAPINPADGQRALWQVTASGANRTLTLATGAGGFVFGTTVTSVPVITSGTSTFIDAIYSSSANRWRVLNVTQGYA